MHKQAHSEASQPIRRMHNALDALANPDRYLFTPADMRALLNPYDVEMGTQSLILSAEALKEIYTDKILAFAP